MSSSIIASVAVMVMGRIRTLAGDEDLGFGRGRRHESRLWGLGEMNDGGRWDI